MLRLRQKLILLAATGGGLGNLPVAPGTFGTLAGIPVAMAVSLLPPGVWVVAAMLVLIVAVWVADEAEAILGEKDPGCIVIDEIAGYLVTMAGMPMTPLLLGLGFLIFRGFDILKPWPVNLFERRFSGGAGVVLDDIVAGLYSAVVLRILFFIMN